MQTGISKHFAKCYLSLNLDFSIRKRMNSDLFEFCINSGSKKVAKVAKKEGGRKEGLGNRLTRHALGR